MTPTIPARLLALEATDLVRAAVLDGHGPVRVLGRYTHGVNLLVGDLVVYASADPVASPAAIRVDPRTLDALLYGADRRHSLDVARAARVETAVPLSVLDPRRAHLVAAAAEEPLAASWFAETPEEWSGRPVLGLLSAAIVADDHELIVEHVRTLMGRGIGLTPSGDDAVVGILAAAIGAGRLTPGARTRIRSLLRDEGPDRTTAVSLTVLRCAVDGHVSPALRAVIMASSPGPDLSGEDLHELVAAAAAHGHTSGCDALCGVVATWQHLSAPADCPTLTRS